MRPGRSLTVLVLALLAFLPGHRATAQDSAPSPRAKATADHPDPTVAEVRAELDSARKELAALRQSVDESKKGVGDAAAATTEAKVKGDTAWVLTSSGLVFLMVPGLALFYGGMVRRKNVLATMMQSMACLAVVGLFWVAVGYSLAFGKSQLTLAGGGLVGWSWDLFFLKGVNTDDVLKGTNVSVYTHVMFQGMFAILTPALISGALAERIRFWPFCVFVLLWVTFVYCPLAHMVWALDWFYDVPVDKAKGFGASAVGLLGKMGALDFAGGTVVHIAAGTAGLACALVLRKRHGYPEHVAHPNSMVLTLLGAGLLWFGWFGFNGGSAGASNPLAASAFAATQAAAATAGLAWLLVEWVAKGKPTALGLASGVVAGLVAVTPASGYVYAYGGVAIGATAAVVCYAAVALKNRLGYDDSLDAFGVHGVGGFVGAVLTGLFCSTMVNGTGDGPFAVRWQEARLAELEKDGRKPIVEAKATADEARKKAADAEAAYNAVKDAADKKDDAADREKALKEAQFDATAAAAKADGLEKELRSLAEKKEVREKDKKGPLTQFIIQTKAAVVSLVFALVASLGLAVLTQKITGGNFATTEKDEAEGLDRTEHGEVGFDFGYATESVPVVMTHPRPAAAPPGNGRYDLQIDGATPAELMKAWSALCQPTDGPPDPDFLAAYPHVTTIQGNRFRCRGGDPAEVAKRLAALFKKQLDKDVTAAKV